MLVRVVEDADGEELVYRCLWRAEGVACGELFVEKAVSAGLYPLYSLADDVERRNCTCIASKSILSEGVAAKRCTLGKIAYALRTVQRAVYLTSSIGKYAFGSCGASSVRSGTQRLYALGRLGGSFDAENAAGTAASTDASSTASVTAGTDACAFPSLSVAGAATLWARELVESGVWEWGVEHARLALRALDHEQLGEPALGDDGQARVRAPDVALPVRVLRRVGRWCAVSAPSSTRGACATHPWSRGWCSAPGARRAAASGGRPGWAARTRSRGSRRRRPGTSSRSPSAAGGTWPGPRACAPRRTWLRVVRRRRRGGGERHASSPPPAPPKLSLSPSCAACSAFVELPGYMRSYLVFYAIVILATGCRSEQHDGTLPDDKYLRGSSHVEICVQRPQVVCVHYSFKLNQPF
jgi:hypothetical protein